MTKYRLQTFAYINFDFKVKGIVTSKDGTAKWVVNGTWDNKVQIAPVTKIDKENGSWQTGPFVSAWQRVLPPCVNFQHVW